MYAEAGFPWLLLENRQRRQWWEKRASLEARAVRQARENGVVAVAQRGGADLRWLLKGLLIDCGRSGRGSKPPRTSRGFLQST